MGITYQVDDSEEIVLECWRGLITADEIARHWKSRLNDQETKACWKTLTDVRECRSAFSTADYRRLVKDLLQPALSGRKFRIAILVSDQLQYGVSRQFQVFFEDNGESAIFTDEPTALAWLQR